jgi:hypothetical protein
MKMTVFWGVAACSLIEFTDVSKVFAASIIRAMIALMMEAASTSKTSVNYHTTRRNNPEDSHLHTCRCENLKSHHTILE